MLFNIMHIQRQKIRTYISEKQVFITTNSKPLYERLKELYTKLIHPLIASGPLVSRTILSTLFTAPKNNLQRSLGLLNCKQEVDHLIEGVGIQLRLDTTG